MLLDIQKENNPIYEELINDMLITYFDRCAPDQVRLFIKYIPFIKRIDLLLDLINKQYPYNKETDMKDGAKLYKFSNNIE